jgi:hypothetical protein
MTVLLKDAIKPNLVQTLEGQPAFIHCGPFANIAHGNSSLVADLVGLKLGDYVVTESGFGADMGMEKLLDIVCRVGGLAPAAIVLVATVRALKHHGGDAEGGIEAVERGAANLARHIGIVKEFGLNAVVAINRFPGDTDDEITTVKRLALELGAHAAAVNWSFEGGGEGAVELAEAVVDAAEQPNEFEPVYPLDAPIADKIEAIAKRVYGADGAFMLPAAENDIKRFTAQGLDTVPICMAKTHLSLTHDPEQAGAPTGFTVPVRAVRAYTGAGWLVALCGDMQTMPGLSTRAAAPLVSSEETPLAAGPAIARTIELAAGLAVVTACVAGRADLAQRAQAMAEQAAPLAAADAEAYQDFLRTRSDEARERTIDLPLRMAYLAADAAEIAAEAAAAAEGPVGGDAKVGTLLAEAAARAAALLVRVNGGGEAAVDATVRAARAAARL